MSVNLTCENFATLHRTDQQCWLASLQRDRRPPNLTNQSTSTAQTADQQNGDPPVEQQHGSRDLVVMNKKVIDEGDRERGQRRNPQQGGEISKGDVSPPTMKTADEVKHDQLERHQPQSVFQIELRASAGTAMSKRRFKAISYDNANKSRWTITKT